MSVPHGKVFVRSRIKRGIANQSLPHVPQHVMWGGYGWITVNVTSQQSKKSVYRIAFSPMHVFDGTYLAPDGVTYACYEHYWQSLKHFPRRNHEVDKTWWRVATKPHRKLPKVDPKTCLYASDETRFPDRAFGYIESRKRFYIPDYRAKLAGCRVAQSVLGDLRRRVQGGMHVLVEDFDGPRRADGYPEIEEITPALLRAKLHDTAFPFGHGYLVAAEILGIAPYEYTDAPEA